MDKKAASTSVHVIVEEHEAATQDQEIAKFWPQQKQHRLHSKISTTWEIVPEARAFPDHTKMLLNNGLKNDLNSELSNAQILYIIQQFLCT
jgi:hypothetical protein